MKDCSIKRSLPAGESELIVNNDKTLYHINIGEEHVADHVILVGDPGRVKTISSYFEKVEFKSSNREFVAHTGFFKGTRITALSTGIGTDNIDIVINELDAAVNFDLENRIPKTHLKKLNLIRIGTSGSLQPDIAVDTYLASSYGLGFDGVLHFYDVEYTEEELEILEAFKNHMHWNYENASPYIVKASNNLLEKIGFGWQKGITATANGFYGPQGRSLRLGLKDDRFNQKLSTFKFNNQSLTNYEMETSALYGIGSALGHNTLTICAIIANRFNKTYSKDYKATVNSLIEEVLNRLTTL